jgi:hypothetical protein
MIRAGRLGNLVAAGQRPAQIPRDDVARVLLERRAEALRSVGDEAAYAVQVHRALWPADNMATVRADGRVDVAAAVEMMNVPRGLQALALLPENPRKIWGLDVLTAAAKKFPVGTCRTCYARAAASVHESMAPRDTPACRVLLGPACTVCASAFAAEKRKTEKQMRELRHSEQESRDRRRIEELDARQRKAAADTKRGADEFARIVKLRKRAGLPPLGGRR